MTQPSTLPSKTSKGINQVLIPNFKQFSNQQRHDQAHSEEHVQQNIVREDGHEFRSNEKVQQTRNKYDV